MDQRSLQVDTIQPLGFQNSSGTSQKTSPAKSAQSMEFWVNVTQIIGDFTFNIETSVDGTNFGVVKQILNVTSPGVYAAVLGRVADPIGIVNRMSWVQNVGGATFKIMTGRME